MSLGESSTPGGARPGGALWLAISMVLFACGEKSAGPEWVDLLLPANETPALCTPTDGAIECIESRLRSYGYALKDKPMPAGTEALLCLVRLCALKDKSADEISPASPWAQACLAYHKRTRKLLALSAPLGTSLCETRLKLSRLVLQSVKD